MTNHSMIPAALLLWISFAAHVGVSQPDRKSVVELLTEAYAVLDTNSARAVPFFEDVIRLDPSNVIAHRQLGSLYLSLGRKTDALQHFQTANDVFPSDTTSLQMAYILEGQGKRDEALGLFEALQTSTAPDVRRKASSAVVTLHHLKGAEQYPWWGKVYASPFYESRFENFILLGSVYGGYYLTPDRMLSLYGTASITKDTRSTGGRLPEILSDNYVLLGTGLRLQPAQGVTADIQGGLSFDILQQGDRSTVRSDFRAVASYGIGVYPESPAPDAARWILSPFADMFSSAGYYSRYGNVIAYMQLRGGFRVAEYRRAALDLYLRGDLAADTEREFYNNIAEASIGARFIPDHLWGISILAEYHRGAYWGGSRSQSPFGAYYNSFRVFLVLDRFLRF